MTNAQRAYDHIRERILAGDFQPGKVISEAALAKELGVSRTPVGEALRELASAGLVEQVPRYGTIVRSITRVEIVELYELREALESYAVALAAQRVTAEDLERLAKLYTRQESFLMHLRESGEERLDLHALREYLAVDMAFHTLLIHAAGNQRIARLIRDSHVMTVLFGTQRVIHNESLVAEVCQYHAQILAAMRAGDAETGRRVAAEHIQRSLAHTLENLDRQRPGADLTALALPREVREELNRIEAALGHREGIVPP
jgi:DNA-binding GntR family transcriptional regulator